MPDTRPWQPSFPGLTLAPDNVGSHEAAVTSTLDYLDGAGALNAGHAALCSVLLDSARRLDRSAGISQAVSHMMRQYAEGLDRLPAPPAVVSDEWSALLAEMSTLADTANAWPAP